MDSKNLYFISGIDIQCRIENSIDDVIASVIGLVCLSEH